MKIHCLCIVKDEKDILAETVQDALTWADNVVIADNGSTDGTQEVVKQLAKNPKVIHLTGYDLPFRDGLRGNMYHEVKFISSPGDWWCRLDADEFYIDDPREFLASMPKIVDTVWSSHFSYQFTDVDYARYQKDRDAFNATPIRERIKHYLNTGGEPRFVRHRFPFFWKGPWPNLRFCSSERRIRIRQYQYRSPEQILIRLKNRQNIPGLFPHEAMASIHSDDWLAQRIHPSQTLDFDDGGPLTERNELQHKIWPLKPKYFPYWLWISWLIIQRPLHKLGLKNEVR